MDSIFNWTLFVRFFCNFVFIFLTGLIGVPERRSFLLSKQKCGNRKSSITVERSESWFKFKLNGKIILLLSSPLPFQLSLSFLQKRKSEDNAR